MPLIINNTTNFDTSIPTTVVFDVGEITAENSSELIVRLYIATNNIIEALNKKDTGYYLTTTFNTGQVFFNANNDFNNLRPIFRIVVPFGALPNNTTKSVAHGITNLGTTWSQVRLDVSSTQPNTKSIDIPGFDPADITKPINVWVDGTNVNIQTTSNMSAFTITWVIFEYILL